MSPLPIIVSTFLLTPFLFPQEFASLFRRIRYRLRNDLRKRLTDEEWNDIRHEFDDP